MRRKYGKGRRRMVRSKKIPRYGSQRGGNRM